jgi:glycosyltransferase involved in cell wall biosynthesis/2-polyprenyl-3-methyl-5-hydroxy-6-metoxy-1,4-benzoquinol methylase/predicted nuclease with TOPRIM domain
MDKRGQLTHSCWCGNSHLREFSDKYSLCATCQTLVVSQIPAPAISPVIDDEHDFYGRQYWFKHQVADLGYPDITTRARTDLPERCLHWLRTVLKYRLPPARALELGSAHGGFVALLNGAGFKATGLDLSPAITDFARRTFGVRMLLGPVEEQRIASGSLDVIALMDVLEHLPDPAGTMRHCLNLLKPDGLLIVQTPKYREGRTYHEMAAEKDRFLEHLKADEHLYLFSQQSVRELFRRVGADHLLFEPAIFAHYDMFFIASRTPIAAYGAEEIRRALSTTPTGRVMQAMVDLDDQFKKLHASHAEAEVDRAARLQTIQRLEQLLAESERDRAARLGVIKAQGTQVSSLHAEVRHWLEQNHALSQQLGNLEAERKVAQARLTELQQQLEVSEADRATHLASIHQLEQSLGDSERDRAARLQNIQRLEQSLAESERDRAARLAVIETQGAQMSSLQSEVRRWEEQHRALSQQVGHLEAERNSLQARLTEVQGQLTASDVDRAALRKDIEEQKSLTAEVTEAAARLREEIASVGEQLKAVGHERDDLRTGLAELQQRLEVSEADRAARGREIEEQRRIASEADAERRRLRAEINYLTARGEEMQTALRRLGQSQTYRLMRALGQWRSLDRPMAAATGTGSALVQSNNNRPPRTLRRVVVDLTPVLAGADNGGAKLLAVELVRHLAQLVPACEWVLLTSEKGHGDLSSLDSRNVRRVCVGADAGNGSGKPSRRARGLARLGMRGGPSSRRSLVRQLDPDLVFCPFTTARFFDPRVPMVTIVYDLQHLAHPEFFSREERAHRDREFRDVCRVATRVVCISEHVRGCVLEHAKIDPSRVVTIHISLFNRLAATAGSGDTDALQRHGLQPGRFLLYPANFWLHKNHEMLLTAFGMYRARHPESDLKLVCSGGLNARREKLQEAMERMGLGGHVMLIEFLPNEEFAALLHACCAVIFPSLCEGFGMPVLEAMAFDKPVLCSNLTSLPEIAGDAALPFDPRKPTEIVRAIEQIETDSELAALLVRRGRSRLAAFGDEAGMARQYLEVFQGALRGDNHSATAIHGVFSDGWTGEHVTVVHEPSSAQRYLEMTLHVPPWLPAESVSVQLGSSGQDGAQTQVIKRKQTVTLRHLLPPASGSVEVQIHPTFQPQALQLGDDTRVLGCLCQSCRILSPSETVELFGGEATR